MLLEQVEFGGSVKGVDRGGERRPDPQVWGTPGWKCEIVEEG